MKFCLFIFPLFISVSVFAQTLDRKILFRGDSIWYAAENQMLFSSNDKGKNWDTIFAKTSRSDTFFLSGTLDTATNIFISDQKTLFVFGWDGTLHYKTILFCSTDYGKTWEKNIFQSNKGIVGVNYFHMISSSQFFLDCRGGFYAVTSNFGKTWKFTCVIHDKYSCADKEFTFHENGTISFGYSKGQKCKFKTVVHSPDGGLTWSESKM